MDPWFTLVRMTETGQLTADHLESVRRLVSSACVARVDQPRTMVSAAIVDQLERGVAIGAAVAVVEELVALRHTRMLIAAGRRGLPGERPKVVDGLARVMMLPISAA